MADSRRINANIREEDEKRPLEEQPPFGVYAVILSSEFWPPFKDEKLEVPEDIREALEVYCRKYEKLKVLPRRGLPAVKLPRPRSVVGSLGLGSSVCVRSGAARPRAPLWVVEGLGAALSHHHRRGLRATGSLPSFWLLRVPNQAVTGHCPKSTRILPASGAQCRCHPPAYAATHGFSRLRAPISLREYQSLLSMTP